MATLKGIDTVTRAIYETRDIEIAKPETVNAVIKRYIGMAVDLRSLSIHQRNQILAMMVRERCIQEGFMSAWSCLVEAAPNMGLQSRLVQDVRMYAIISIVDFSNFVNL